MIEKPLKNKKLPKVLSLFCGAGGLDLGFKQNGFDIALAIDFEKAAIETHQANFVGTRSMVADLVKIGPEGVVDILSREVKKGETLGVIGGPPCQGFSRANRNAYSDDPRNQLPALYIKIIKELKKHWKVKFVVFENVVGIKDQKHLNTYKSLINDLKESGFKYHEEILCARDFGVAQNRRRVIIVATDINSSEVTIKRSDERKSVRDIIGGLEEPAYFRKSLVINDIPEHPNHWTMQPRSNKFTSDYIPAKNSRSFRRLNWDKASPTIAFGNREIHVHPSGIRRLSIFEALLLQGFPRIFVLKGNLSQQVQQVSNAVPPPMAKEIARAVAQSLNLE